MTGRDEARPNRRCGSCGYANRADARTCNLCGEYLYAAVAEGPEVGGSPEPPAPRPPAPAAAAAIVVGEGDAGGVEGDPEGTSMPLPPAAPRPALALDAAEEEEEEEEEPEVSAGSLLARPSAAPRAVPAPRPAAREDARPQHDVEAAAVEWMLRVRARRISHGWAGVVLTLVVATAFGLPSSLWPSALVLNAVASACFGFPLGYAISRLRLGAIGGALLGAAFGFAFVVPRAAVLVMAGGMAAAWAPAELLAGMAAGIVPGACIGYHVEHDV